MAVVIVKPKAFDDVDCYTNGKEENTQERLAAK
jgi:hypothetical protein